MRDIAKAAGISEALIYRHFSSKEVLYQEIYFYIDLQINAMGEYFAQHEPKTETLVQIIYALVWMILTEMPGRNKEQKQFERLLVYSLLENTSFAKFVFRQYDLQLMPLWEASIEVALERGELYEPMIGTAVKMWLSHHLLMAVNFLHLSGEPLFPYEGSKMDLISGVVIFILRGVGLKDEIIREHVQPDLMIDKVEKIFNSEFI